MQFEVFVSKMDPQTNKFHHFANIKLNAQERSEAIADALEIRMGLAAVGTFKVEMIEWPTKEGSFINF